jgi:uncharacterized membrane protein YhhN
MTIIYILIFVASAIIEISDRCNTKNAFKKIGLGFVMVGCLLNLSHRPNEMLAIGLCLFLAAELTHAYLHRKNRRAHDKGHSQYE